MPPCRYTRCLLLLLHSAAAAEAVTLADFLYQRLSKFRVGGENNIFHQEPGAASGVEVAGEAEQGQARSPVLAPASLHLTTQPLVYTPNLENNTATQYESVENNKFDLKNFIKEQKSKLEDLYIVQLAKNIINFKKAKFEELKNFLEYKANRWENIITNEKSKIEEYLANTDIFDINNVKNLKDAKLEDLVELIKLKKLKIGELLALNQLLELKQSKLQEVRNLIELKKSKVSELLSNSVLATQDTEAAISALPEVIAPEYVQVQPPAAPHYTEAAQPQPRPSAYQQPRTASSDIRSELDTTPINVAVPASKIFSTAAQFETFRRAKSAPAAAQVPYTAEVAETSSAGQLPQLIRYREINTAPSHHEGEARLNRDIAPAEVIVVNIDQEESEGEVTMLQQVSFEDQQDLDSYIDNVFEDRLDSSEERNDDEQYGQEWDIMEDYLDLNVAPTNLHLVDADVLVSNDVVDPYAEDPAAGREEEGSRFGQQWEVMTEYVDSPAAGGRGVEPRLTASDGDENTNNYFDYMQRDGQSRVDGNQHLAFNTEIVLSQEENPYYNQYNPMVHEHLSEDYSGFIPPMNSEYADYGLNTGYYELEPSLPTIPTHVHTNHLDTDEAALGRDLELARNTGSDIESAAAEQSATTSEPGDTGTGEEEAVTATTATTAAQTADSETTEAVTETPTTTAEAETPDTTTAPSSHPDTSTAAGSEAALELTLPPALQALSLVKEQLPDPEPLQHREQPPGQEELFVLPAGHGLRFKFKIKDLNYYNPDFGFES